MITTYGYVGVRGFSRPGDYNSRILILVDGRRVDDSIYQSSSVQKSFPIDIDLIDRVEMIRGPGSALYGSAAMIGLVNVIIKRGRDYNGFEASAELQSYETYKLRGTYGVRLPSGFELLLSASVYESKLKARGLEVEIEGNWLSGIDGSLSYSYVDGHNVNSSSDLINAPEHMAQLSFGYPILSDKLTGTF